jgi:hypothetical protein
MRESSTFNAAKKLLLRGVFAVALTAAIGFQGTGLAARGQQLWSIVIHFQYQDGFEFDYVLERGVSASDLGAALAECGRSHSVGAVVEYHCVAVPE